MNEDFVKFQSQKSLVGWWHHIKHGGSFWDLEFPESEHKFDDNDEGEPKDPEEGTECDPIGKLLSGDSEESSEEEEQSWVMHAKESETYFTIINSSGRTVQPGEQLFYRYGKKSNAGLLLNYSFAFEGNKYDFCEILLKLEPDSLKPEGLVCLDNTETEGVQECRVKLDELNPQMMAYLRLVA